MGWRREAPTRYFVPTLAITVIFVSGACASSTDGVKSSTAITVVPGAAKVDENSGIIQQPLDEYDITRSERAVVLTANDLAMSRCMQAAGDAQYFPFFDRRNPAPEVDWRFGVWVPAQVAKYGYQKPPPGATEKKLLAANAVRFPPAVDEQYKECITVVHGQGLAFATPPDNASNDTVQQDPMTTTPAKAAVAEWHACLRKHEVPLPADQTSWFPAGVMQAPPEEQIAIGLIDVGCKQQTHLVQRLADVEAATQQSYIATHEAALVAKRNDAQKVLRTARAYLAQRQAS